MDKNVENKLLCDVGPSGWRRARMLSVNFFLLVVPGTRLIPGQLSGMRVVVMVEEVWFQGHISV